MKAIRTGLLAGVIASLRQKDECAGTDDGSVNPLSGAQSLSSQNSWRLRQALRTFRAADPTERPGGRIYSGDLAPDI